MVEVDLSFFFMLYLSVVWYKNKLRMINSASLEIVFKNNDDKIFSAVNKSFIRESRKQTKIYFDEFPGIFIVDSYRMPIARESITNLRIIRLPRDQLCKNIRFSVRVRL